MVSRLHFGKAWTINTQNRENSFGSEDLVITAVKMSDVTRAQQTHGIILGPAVAYNSVPKLYAGNAVFEAKTIHGSHRKLLRSRNIAFMLVYLQTRVLVPPCIDKPDQVHSRDCRTHLPIEHRLEGSKDRKHKPTRLCSGRLPNRGTRRINRVD
jgi:hypothetical protein